MLSVVNTADERLAGPDLLERVRAFKGSHGSAVVLAPTPAQCLLIQKELAHAGLGLRSTVDTPDSWVQSQWELFGDGRHPVSDAERLIFLKEVIDSLDVSLAKTHGTVEFIGTLAQKGIRSVSVGEHDSKSEIDVNAVLRSYSELLEEYDRVELINVIGPLCAKLASASGSANTYNTGVIFVGFTSMDVFSRALLDCLSSVADVEHIVHEDAPLAALASEVSVELVYPSGPAAEAEAIFECIQQELDAGAKHIVVAHADIERIWSEAAPKLAARGIPASCLFYVPLVETPEVRTTLSWIEFVALRERDASTWWPASRVVDFLLNEVSHTPQANAWNLDKQWRANRALSAQDVLDALLNEEAASAVCAQATKLLMEERLADAIQVLIRGLNPTSYAFAALNKLYDLARLVERDNLAYAYELLVTSIQKVHVARSFVIELDSELESGSEHKSGIEPEHGLVRGSGLEQPGIQVEFVSPTSLSTMEARSADAVIYLGLDSQTSAIPIADTTINTLLDRLEVEPLPDTLHEAEHAFAQAIAVPKNKLYVGRTLYNEKSEKAYPSLMLTELVLCFEDGDGTNELEEQARVYPETSLSKNLLAGSVKKQAVATEQPSDELSSQSKTAFLASIKSTPEKEFSLSPTSIESYIDCPRRWLLTNYIRQEQLDRGFGALEKGSFSHNVLYDVYSEIVKSGERVNGNNLVAVQSLLEETFNRHLVLQLTENDSVQNPLVPQRVGENEQVDELRENLLDYLEVESQRFTGFRPVACECYFGKPRAGQGSLLPNFTYAGVPFSGIIDRIDINTSTKQVLIVDYKRGNASFNKRYSLRQEPWSKAEEDAGLSYVLPVKIQSLVYVAAVRQMIREKIGPFAELEDVEQYRVAASLYVAVNPRPYDKNNTFDMAGIVDDSLFTNMNDDLWGGLISSRTFWRIERRQRPYDVGLATLEDVLDRVEADVSAAVQSILAGDVEPNPREYVAGVCDFCPVKNSCERSLAK